MTRDLPRRRPSRNPTSRPRRVAGQAGVSQSGEDVDETTQAPPARLEEPSDLEEAPEPSLVEPLEPPGTPEPPATDDEAEAGTADVPPDADPDADPGADSDEVALEPRERRGMGALFDSRRVTVVLVVLVLLLGGGGAALVGYQALDDDETSGTPSPVVISGDDATDAVASAAESAETIVATSYEDYDDQVDEATKLMTDSFAKEYRQTAEDIKQRFVDAKTEIQVRVVAQGIVKASSTEVQALVFLDQYTSKDGGDTTYTPYRLLATVVHTDRGWLVSDLDTK